MGFPRRLGGVVPSSPGRESVAARRGDRSQLRAVGWYDMPTENDGSRTCTLHAHCIVYDICARESVCVLQASSLSFDFRVFHTLGGSRRRDGEFEAEIQGTQRPGVESWRLSRRVFCFFLLFFVLWMRLNLRTATRVLTLRRPVRGA